MTIQLYSQVTLALMAACAFLGLWFGGADFQYNVILIVATSLSCLLFMRKTFIESCSFLNIAFASVFLLSILGGISPFIKPYVAIFSYVFWMIVLVGGFHYFAVRCLSKDSDIDLKTSEEFAIIERLSSHFGKFTSIAFCFALNLTFGFIFLYNLRT